MHAVILSRVSSEEQKLGFSPESQTDNCFDYAKKLKFEVIHNSQFDESASYMSKTGKREKFWEIIEVIVKDNKTTKSRIALVCDTVDRLQRGYREFGMLEEMILNNQLEIHFVSDKLMVNKDNLYEEEGKRWRDLVNDAFNHVYRIRKNAQKGMKKSREKNIVYKVPEGYVRKNGEVEITNSSELIIEAFELFSTGKLNQVELTVHLNNKGFKTRKGIKLSNQTLNKILNNPFYYGVAKSRYGDYPHQYKTIISKTTFDKCQAILREKENSGKKQKRGYISYTFRNLLSCSECSRTINPYTAKGKYNYCRCVNPDCKYYQKGIREVVLLEQAEEVLTNLVFPDEAIEFIVDKLK